MPGLAAGQCCLIEKKSKNYAFWRQFGEKPSTTPGCPGRCRLIPLYPKWYSDCADEPFQLASALLPSFTIRAAHSHHCAIQMIRICNCPKHLFALQAVFALAGGPLPAFRSWLGRAASVLPQVWLVAYHSKLSKLQWNFRPYDPTMYKVKIDACHGTFRLTATRWRESLVITIRASVDSFAALLCPTDTGFRNGSVQSFAAKAHIEAYMYHVWPLSHAGWQLIEAQDMSIVALEFGGQYRC